MSSKFISFLFLSIFCLSTQFSGYSQNTIETEIQSILAPFTGNDKPGCSIAILQKNEPVFVQGYGLANLEHHIAFTPQTVSDIGSVAKQFTCFAILLLEEEGKLSINDNINQYLDGIPDFGEPILIHHLMSHTSGLREIYGARAVAGGRSGDGILQEDALRLVQHSKELNFPTGTRYNYCNTAYMLLADIVAKVSGKSFESFMQEQIFAPLGMHHTFIMDIQGECFLNHADSYRTRPDGSFQKVYANSTVQGAGGMYTTMDDLVKWAQNLTDPQVGSQAIINKMSTAATLKDASPINYGFGLQTADQYGLENFRHSGSSAGYRAFLGHYKKDDLTILIKTNNGEIPRTSLIRAILQHYTDAVIESAEQNENSDSPIYMAMTDKEMTLYEGTYMSRELDMVYTVKKEGTRLILQSLRNGDIPLHNRGEANFTTSQWYLRNLQFEIKKGKSTGFRVDNGRVMGLWFERI